MSAFEKIIEVADTLMGEGGCPWDRKQTFESLRPYLIEESAEALEAIEGGDDKEIVEELADLLYVIIFYAKVAEKEKRFTIDDILDFEREKLIRRHPHVFGDVELEDMDHLMQVWNDAKQKEKEGRESRLDGIPKGLPMLARAQKIVKRLTKNHFLKESEAPALSEQEAGEKLFELAQMAEREGIDLESALRSATQKREKAFRDAESAGRINHGFIS